jgi:hypothetical protein
VAVAAGRLPRAGLVTGQHVQLELEPELRLEAEGPPTVDGAGQGAARAQRQRLAVLAEQLTDGDVGVRLPARTAGGGQRHGREVGEADVAGVPGHRQDLALRAHDERRDGVVGRVVEAGRRDVAAVRQAVEVGPEGADTSLHEEPDQTRRASSTRLIWYSTSSSASAADTAAKRCGCSGVQQLGTGDSTVHGRGWQNCTTL